MQFHGEDRLFFYFGGSIWSLPARCGRGSGRIVNPITLRIFKRILYGILGLLTAAVLLMLIPRVHSVLFPEKPAMGYHYLWTTYLAIQVGLEDVIKTDRDIPDNLEAIRDIEYKNVDGKSLQLDFLRPRAMTKPAPLVVMLHGGSWRYGRRTDMTPLMIDLANRGYVTATVSYRLKETYPNCVEDAVDAIDWFFAHGQEYGYDADRIAIVGASAGAHLAMMAGYNWREKTNRGDSASNLQRIRAVVNLFGPVDLTTDFGRKQPSVLAFMAQPYQDAPDLWLEASPIVYIDRNVPPTMTIHGTSDELVPNSQADQLNARLDSMGVARADYRFPLWPHALILVQRVYDSSMLKIVEFLEEHLAEVDSSTVIRNE